MSKLRCVSFTVCDSGSSQFAHKMSHTRSREDGGEDVVQFWNFFFFVLELGDGERLDADQRGAERAAAWYLWCESSGRSKEAQM